MRVLTIDTATTAAAIGLVDGEDAVDAPPVREAASAQHVLRVADALLAGNGVAIGDIDRIVVGRGPGSFTGLRIGMATALGLAAPRGTDVVGVTTTAALRRAAGPHAVAVVDARRGEVFVEGPDLPLLACTPAELVTRVSEGALLVGDGATRYREELAGCDIPPDDSPLHVPSAATMVELAVARGPATPVYVRAPDAIPTDERR